MSEEPDNLILKLLREMRGETTATATGFAMHANLRGQSLEAEIEELKRRVESLEEAQ
jgi:hypothetical protein